MNAELISVDAVINDVPHFDVFCSVGKLHKLVNELRKDARFSVSVAGRSVNGIPIQHVRFGSGRTKVLVVAGPHAMEPIGSLTAYSLMKLLQQRNSSLMRADVEWHIVPCIDPDGAILNEGWTQKEFGFDNYVRNFHVQAFCDQVDASFPIRYKKLVFDRPSKEASVLQRLLEEVQPDFFFTLHNAWAAGAFYLLTGDIRQKYHEALHAILRTHRVPIQEDFREAIFPARFAPGIFKMPSIKGYYDYLERTMPHPETVMPNAGANSYEYLAEIKPSAVTFVAELGYFRISKDASAQATGLTQRQILLRQEANTKCLATSLFEEWERVKDEVERTSPFYKAFVESLISKRERLVEGGMPLMRYTTRDILFNPRFGRAATRADEINAHLFDGGVFFLRDAYQFVRLLKASKKTVAVHKAIARLEREFDRALADTRREVCLDDIEVIDCETLAKVQLGSGLIALNAVLDKTGRRVTNSAGDAGISRTRAPSRKPRRGAR
jgi:hypothetical protein